MVKGKHKNCRQDKIFLDFMKKNTDIAKGFTKRDKYVIDALWDSLAKDLNGQGPPTKDVSGWKKVWVDWKKNIRKKIAHNKNEKKKTGGGPDNTLPITATEDSIAILTAIYTAVSGIPNTMAFGDETVTTEDTFNIINDVYVTSEDVSHVEETTETDRTGNGPEMPLRRSNRSENVENYMEHQKKIFLDISKEMKTIGDATKENKYSMKRTYRAIEKLEDAMKEQTKVLREQNEAQKRHYEIVERTLLQKIEIKKIEIKRLISGIS